MLAKSHFSGIDLPGLLSLVVILGAVLWPLLFGRRQPPPEQSGPDSDGGGGSRPPEPSTPPDAPRGGVPLDDAEPARVRLRDHVRLADRLPPRHRRPVREPDRERPLIPGRRGAASITRSRVRAHGTQGRRVGIGVTTWRIRPTTAVVR